MKDLQNVKNINEVAYDFLVSFNPDKYIDGRLNLESIESLKPTENILIFSI